MWNIPTVTFTTKVVSSDINLRARTSRFSYATVVVRAPYAWTMGNLMLELHWDEQAKDICLYTPDVQPLYELPGHMHGPWGT